MLKMQRNCGFWLFDKKRSSKPPPPSYYSLHEAQAFQGSSHLKTEFFIKDHGIDFWNFSNLNNFFREWQSAQSKGTWTLSYMGAFPQTWWNMHSATPGKRYLQSKFSLLGKNWQNQRFLGRTTRLQPLEFFFPNLYFEKNFLVLS